MTVKAKIRLFVDAPLGVGQSLSLPREQTHYIIGVLRQKVVATRCFHLGPRVLRTGKTTVAAIAMGDWQ